MRGFALRLNIKGNEIREFGIPGGLICKSWQIITVNLSCLMYCVTTVVY